MKNHGFTLLELIITIAMAAVLLSIALPAMRNFIQDTRMTAQANELVTALNLARSEALKRGGDVALCASDDGATCTDDWQDGWIVAEDPDAATPQVIRVFEQPDTGADVTSEPANTVIIGFAASGMLDDSVTLSEDAACDSAVCFDLTIDDATRCRAGHHLGKRKLVVPRTGGVRIEHQPCEGD